MLCHRRSTGYHMDMQYISHYESPLGSILLAADDIGLTGLWFEGQRYFARGLDEAAEEKDLPVFNQARSWLNIYFAGKEPQLKIPLHITGSDFFRKVTDAMLSIPYGRTITYGEIASAISEKHCMGNVSARAVGGAVGHNTISIIVPCHRVIGAGGNLTGYAGGIDRKIQLLKLEGIDTASFSLPQANQ